METAWPARKTRDHSTFPIVGARSRLINRARTIRMERPDRAAVGWRRKLVATAGSLVSAGG